MALTASSSLTDLRTAYVEKATFRQTGSVSDAQEFAAACRWLLLRVPEETNNRDGGVKMNLAQLQTDLADVTSWLADNAPPAPVPASSTASNVRLMGFNYGRD